MSEEKGKVYLIGAGPGDAGLITMRGAEFLGEAQVVIYDSLVNTDILRFCRHDAELVFAGKTTGRKQISQDKINELLVAKAKEGKTVARLKGGPQHFSNHRFRWQSIDCCQPPPTNIKHLELMNPRKGFAISWICFIKWPCLKFDFYPVSGLQSEIDCGKS